MKKRKFVADHQVTATISLVVATETMIWDQLNNFLAKSDEHMIHNKIDTRLCA